MANPDDKFEHVFTSRNTGKIDDDYQVDRRALGEGSYGTVKRGKHKHTNAIRAVKTIKKKSVKDEKQRARLNAEIDIQMKLDHPNIVKYFDSYEDNQNIYLILELCDGGELFDRILEETEKHEGSAFSEQDVARYMKQILGAMQYLHSRNYAHRDIKPENFLLQNKSRDAEIKVIDFGLAKNYSDGELMKTQAGTPYYVAPQVLQRTGYDEKCDIWSCGVICYILICGYPPFYGDSDQQILDRVKKGTFDYPASDWAGHTDEVKDFINLMLTMDPKARHSAEALLQHPWVQMSKSGASVEVKLNKSITDNMRKFRRASKFKKVVLTMIAQNLPDSEVDDLRKTFAHLDADCSGTLTIPEIMDGLQKHSMEVPPDMLEILQGLDTDGSGVVDYSEFLAATLERKTYMKEDMAWSAFRMFDKDRDGVITKAELAAVLQDPDFKECVKIMKEVDTDKDGTISFDEFKQMLAA